MNATQTFTNGSRGRQLRIKNVSSMIRLVFVLLLTFYGSIFLIGWFGAIQQINAENAPFTRGIILEWLLGAGISIGKGVQLWMAYKLFSGFATGSWFSAGSTNWLRRIGYMSMIVWALGLLMFIPLAWGQFGFDHIQYLPAMEQLRRYVGFATACVRSNAELLTGLLLLFMAWVMDEGRKIQEEQELTV